MTELELANYLKENLSIEIVPLTRAFHVNLRLNGQVISSDYYDLEDY